MQGPVLTIIPPGNSTFKVYSLETILYNIRGAIIAHGFSSISKRRENEITFISKLMFEILFEVPRNPLVFSSTLLMVLLYS